MQEHEQSTGVDDERAGDALLDEEDAEEILDSARVTTFEGELDDDDAAANGELGFEGSAASFVEDEDDEDDEVDDDDLDGDLDEDLLDDELLTGGVLVSDSGLAPIGPDEVGTGASAAAPAAAATAPTAADERLRRLEAAAAALAAAEVTRESKRVRRKVSAATTGAGAIGFIPILLQLVGALDLSPEMAATVSTVAASVGAFAVGFITPERQPPLPDPDAHALLALGDRRR
jgi:hypothetical protein